MASLTQTHVLAETILPQDGVARLGKQVALVVAGVALMWIAAKIKLPMWPVPATMQTFVLLTIGASYGVRLSVITLLAYVTVGALGFDVFAGSSTDNNGLSYMLGQRGAIWWALWLPPPLWAGWRGGAGTAALPLPCR